MSWTDCQWIDVAARLLRDGDGAHLRRSELPHVIDDPPGCDRCERWTILPLNDGLCADCLDEMAADEASERAAPPLNSAGAVPLSQPTPSEDR